MHCLSRRSRKEFRRVFLQMYNKFCNTTFCILWMLQLGFSHWQKNVLGECLSTGCRTEYLNLRRSNLWEAGEVCIMRRFTGAHPASSYAIRRRDFFSLGIKRPGREADHSPPSSTEDNNAWSYSSVPQYVFMAWCLFKHRENFLLLLFSSSSH
jgi:hypothetical protein